VANKRAVGTFQAAEEIAAAAVKAFGGPTSGHQRRYPADTALTPEEVGGARRT
jgi:hypothetical protein